ncbi:MAG: MotA/TolQ/ExbB proton channel family protein [Sneathiellaceae bacterium]
MSISTLIGVLVGFGLFLGAIAISTDNYIVFLSVPSLVIVLGGTLAAAFISFEARYVMQALRALGEIFKAPSMRRNMLNAEVGRVIRWGYLAQRGGVVALESEINKDDDPFLRFGLELIVTGYDGNDVLEILENSAYQAFQRRVVISNILRSMGSTSPAFGMIGTLVGLIVMLATLGDDPSKLGPGLAIALITTLYGVLAARLVFMPTSAKIAQREDIQRFRNHLMAVGMAMLADKRNPRYIQDRMNSFLDPDLHYDIDRQMKDAPGVAAAMAARSGEGRRRPRGPAGTTRDEPGRPGATRAAGRPGRG